MFFLAASSFTCLQWFYFSATLIVTVLAVPLHSSTIVAKVSTISPQTRAALYIARIDSETDQIIPHRMNHKITPYKMSEKWVLFMPGDPGFEVTVQNGEVIPVQPPPVERPPYQRGLFAALGMSVYFTDLAQRRVVVQKLRDLKFPNAHPDIANGSQIKISIMYVDAMLKLLMEEESRYFDLVKHEQKTKVLAGITPQWAQMKNEMEKVILAEVVEAEHQKNRVKCWKEIVGI
ncbi:uncharacterized protein C8R40DRAFT_1171124 [Lentinula edodes]|uniref:uncharacterized protein n=1 Tax=Lentinula edodes TaxID=5353 RepID=UPI001E8E7A5E|nr:uncharacterized protein C8R40DRAFT_1171124 [Lentinula edodes]KAH7875015.1 hypothetical protein C8R40DRAFT_1171124 [Lentinula edodes]